eukprot:TRINITY_DN80587_c0_g1_i1.p1 TRINITY_DN80587_c0_g1~~TRINITY_DN80587_c0_g1_i1.p1  ORF type:complete len:245 (-),score=65.87 TRINITY_DN80587_c0_g1_i1:48-782(-)
MGKVILVTGGSRGIGAEIVKQFALAGAHVVFSYAKAEDKAKALEQEVTEQGGQAIGVKADNSNKQECLDLVKYVKDNFGSLDVLVNNAGILVPGMIGDDKEAVFDQLIQVNVKAVWTITNAAVELMGDGGRIINIGSAFGERVISPGFASYAASKFAVQGLTRGWARDLGSRKITVNVVQPGAIDTDMMPDIPQNPGAAAVKLLTPLAKMGTVGDVAPLVLFLASTHASFITGAVLSVDGGLMA